MTGSEATPGPGAAGPPPEDVPDDYLAPGVLSRLARLHEEYPERALADIAPYREALAAAPPGALDPALVRTLRAVAHDLHGQGGSFGYPLVSRIAAVLSHRLKAGPLDRETATACFDAIARVLEERITDADGTAGSALLAAVTGPEGDGGPA